MASKLRILTTRFLLSANIVVVIVFLLACLVPHLDPRQWWFISFLGLAFPFLLLIVVIFFVSWFLVLKPRLAIFSALALLLGYKNISVLFAFHNSGAFDYAKDPKTLRVVSWNVARFIELKENNNKGSQIREKMFDLIRAQNADVLCLQEFHTSIMEGYYDNITPIQHKLNYPYFYFSFDTDGDKHFYSSIIFSRLPIVDSGLIRFPRPTLPDALIHADLKWGNDTVRIYTTHLQSLQFSKSDYDRLRKIREGDDSIMENSKNVLSKIKRGFTNRSIQADLIREILGDSPHPLLVCADLNDVPNSYTYSTVRGKLQDAFLKKGFGVGRTFASLSPTLRIDYIFADKNFRIKQFNRLVKRYSDHYMLVADLELKK